MASTRHGATFGKGIAGLVLAATAYLGLQYGAALRDMDRAAALYEQGNFEGALETYERVEHRIRAHRAMRVLPAGDRRTLFLNQALLHYRLKQYDEAADQLRKEDQVSGAITDGRFFLLRGNITYRRAVRAYQESAPRVPTRPSPDRDVGVFEQDLLVAQDNYRQSLQLDPNEWDAKYNFEFVDAMRQLLADPDEEPLKFLGETPEIEAPPPGSVG